MDLNDILSKMLLFNGVEYDQIDSLLSRIPHRIRKYNKGTHIAFSGEKLRDAMILIEGTVHTTITSDNGNNIIFDIIDEPFFLAPALPHAYTQHFVTNIYAETNCQVLYLDGNSLSDEMQFSSRLMKNYMALQTERIEFLTTRINELVLLSMKERIINYMQRTDRPVKSVELLARTLGVKRPSLSRVIKELKVEGRLERTMDGLELVKIKRTIHPYPHQQRKETHLHPDVLQEEEIRNDKNKSNEKQ